MVGHTLTAKAKLYRYYRCRHKYDKNTGRDCTSRYVSADLVEASVREEVIRVLSDPRLVLSELAREDPADHEAASAEAAQLEREISSIESRQKRLIQLYTLAEVDDEFVREEAAKLQWQRSLLEDQLSAVRKPQVTPLSVEDAEQLQEISALIAEWLEAATEDQWTLVFEALQLRIQATTSRVTISGVLPVEAPKFVTIAQTSA